MTAGRCALALTIAVTVVGCASSSSDDGNPAVDAAPVNDAGPLPDTNSSDARPPCVEGAARVQDQTTGHCYIYFGQVTNWTAARLQCEALGPDVELASITDDAENTLVLGLVSNNEAWIGGNDLIAEGTFEWLTNEPFAYDNWRAGEPNDASGEDCVLFQGQLAGAWDDRDCNDPAPFVCERP